MQHHEKTPEKNNISYIVSNLKLQVVSYILIRVTISKLNEEIYFKYSKNNLIYITEAENIIHGTGNQIIESFFVISE